MSALCGAWSLSGQPVETLLGETDRRAMLALLPGGLAELRQGPLWLAAAKPLLAREGSRLLAVEGFLAGASDVSDPVRALLERLKRGEQPPLPWDGHYAFAYADTDAGSLTLYRDPGGGERLYWLLLGDLLFFAASIRPLLGHSGVRRELDVETAAEQVMNKALVFGDRTLWAGVREVPPGSRLVVSRGEPRCLPGWDPARPKGLSSGCAESEDAADLPGRLRVALQGAVSGAVGRDKTMAVALSGGIDSACVAVCAVEALGAAKVTAFTYEFEDPSHASETAVAAAFCRRLGIGHRVVRTTRREYLDAIPETVWRMEHPFDIKHGPQMMLLCREVGRRGFGKVLTGNGIEQCLGIFCHDGYLERLCRALAWLPFPDRTLAHWRAKVFKDSPRGPLSWALGALGGMEPPPREIYYAVLSVLRHNGLIRDVGEFYPADLRKWARTLVESARVKEAVAASAGTDLASQLRGRQFHFFGTRCSIKPIQKAGREAGALPVSPAFFASCLDAAPQAYRHTRGNVAAARALQRRAFRDAFGEEPVFSPKPAVMELSQTVVSPAWYREGLGLIDAAVAPELAALASRFPGGGRAALERYPENLAQLAFWHRLFIGAAPGAGAPEWEQ